MAYNPLKLAFKSLQRNRLVAGINLLGLALGFAVCTLIFLMVLHERDFDRFHSRFERIYRLNTTSRYEGAAESTGPYSSYPMGPFLASTFEKEIENYTRLSPIDQNFVLTYKGQANTIRQVFAVDSSFFQVFDFPLLVGNPRTVFDDQHNTFHNSSSEQKSYSLVRLNTKDLKGSMQQIQKVFDRVLPSSAFDYVFLDEHLDTLYRREHRTAMVVLVFSCLSILIACLGLFGLAAFTAERRTKEIGVRKVLGASVGSIVRLLSRDFLGLVLISLVFAAPVAWYFMHNWLKAFAFRIEIQWWVFALAGFLSLLIAFLTVSVQSVRAATANPVKSLRSE